MYVSLRVLRGYKHSREIEFWRWCAVDSFSEFWAEWGSLVKGCDLAIIEVCQ